LGLLEVSSKLFELSFSFQETFPARIFLFRTMLFRRARNGFKEWVDEISIRMSNSLSAVAIVLMVIGTYVLVFSSIPLLYKVIIVVYIFVLLFLFSLALLSLEAIEKPGTEWRTLSQKAFVGRGSGSGLLCCLLKLVP
jgi:hypothetical protein